MNKIQTWNVAKWRAGVLRMLATGKALMLLIMVSALFFVVLGLGGMAERKLNTSSISSMKGFAGSISSGIFMDMLGMELPHLAQGKQQSEITGEQITSFVFEMLTGVDPLNPKSLIASQVPGMGTNEPVLLRIGSGNEKAEAPQDYQPDPGYVAESSGKTPGQAEPDPEPSPDPGESPAPSNTDPGTEVPGKVTENQSPAEAKKKTVLIYHTHPHEAYNPLLGTKSNNPSSPKASANVFLPGSYLMKRLESQGIGVVHETEDYVATKKDYNWNYSYKYSRETVKAAMAANDDLTYLIDIHRDSSRHDKSTATINGKSYAKVFFIIGHDNPNWEKNEAYAAKIHKKMEKLYPGLSRGVWGKNGGGGNNGEYNQSLSENSILIEIGGIDNTDAELKRTSEALADIIAEVYMEDQKIDKASTDQNPSSSNKG
ncbi:stage II sporulation protein P [Paenibacillus sp. J45TS6]|uniref:stage II sporulation protein P n=1 Tax=Paenibacillus sp. J45TS6 TaxID=2807196 RepID=UPI001B0C871D|nr:stage II sporulation protein P [Paenibacillus sp. J45TS6]GIP42068.1 stage II sporulation protein P [Paenibacillus sp. J45TS6]